MNASLGILGLAVATASCVIGAAVLITGAVREDTRLVRQGRYAVVGLAAGAILAVGAMEAALLQHDFTIRYVAENNARATPILFTITGLWASLEGSILLWLLVLAGFIGWVAWRFRARLADPVVVWALAIMLLVAAFFCLLTLGPANPFETYPGTAPSNGAGPNPLLQEHILMAGHPPMLYLGYVGFTVPFAFAMGALITGRFGEGWLADVRRTTLLAWIFLTVGIILGGWWSYEVLGWGGYWAWDPVENASFLPWLTGTAFIHSVMVQERRAMLRVWNLSLVLATFSLTILGTFLTRSGVLASVHAFSESDIGPWLLAFLGLVVVSSLVLLAWRADSLWTPGRIDAVVSREGAFLANNLLFTAFALVVLVGTVFPLLVEALQDRRLTVGEPYFNRMTAPLGLALLFLMAVGPVLPWRAASAKVLRRRLLIPAYIGVVAMVLSVLLGARGLAPVLAFGLAGFALATIGWQFVIAARRGIWKSIRGNPRLYGGLVVHVGVVMIAVAFTASTTFTTREEARLAVGESVSVAGYRVTFLGLDQVETGQKTKVSARLQLVRGGRDLGVYEPAISSFPNSMQGIGTPSVRTGVLADVYLTLISSRDDAGRATIGVAVNPLVVWLWIGGGVMVAGTAIALMPKRRSSPIRVDATVVAAGDPPPDPDDDVDPTHGASEVVPV